MPNATISVITLPSGVQYDIKDAKAREDIAALQSYTDYLGVTSTALTDGATTNPIVINEESVTAKKGNIVNYGSKEFIFNGTAWQEFGDMSGLGSLAYKNSATGSTTLSTPDSYSTTFTGKQATISVSGTTAGSVDETKGVVAVTTAVSGAATYTPAGTNADSAVTASGSFTPQGSVAAPTISVKTAGTTASIEGIDSVGTLPSATMPTYEVVNDVLTITAGTFSAGSLPTKATAVTVKTGDATYEATAPAFTGTEGSVSVSGTAAGQTFTGTGARLVTDGDVLTGASFTGASMSSTGSYTPEADSVSTTATSSAKTIEITVS